MASWFTNFPTPRGGPSTLRVVAAKSEPLQAEQAGAQSDRSEKNWANFGKEVQCRLWLSTPEYWTFVGHRSCDIRI